MIVTLKKPQPDEAQQRKEQEQNRRKQLRTKQLQQQQIAQRKRKQEQQRQEQQDKLKKQQQERQEQQAKLKKQQQERQQQQAKLKKQQQQRQQQQAKLQQQLRLRKERTQQQKQIQIKSQAPPKKIVSLSKVMGASSPKRKHQTMATTAVKTPAPKLTKIAIDVDTRIAEMSSPIMPPSPALPMTPATEKLFESVSNEDVMDASIDLGDLAEDDDLNAEVLAFLNQ